MNDPHSEKATITGLQNRASDFDEPAPKVYTWGLIQYGSAGDCTMFEGARWTLYPNGAASFDGTVTSSDDNDTWSMWLHLKDAAGNELGWLRNFDSPGETNKFSKFMPDSSQRYRWFVNNAYFDATLFPSIAGMTMDYRC